MMLCHSCQMAATLAGSFTLLLADRLEAIASGSSEHRLIWRHGHVSKFHPSDD